MLGQPELLILFFLILIGIIIVGPIRRLIMIIIRGFIIFLTGGGKDKSVKSVPRPPVRTTPPPVRTAPPQSPAPPVVKEVKNHHKKIHARKCPNCGAKLTELSYYKLKSGESSVCDYCNEIISS